MDQATAEDQCQQYGGHLASYTSLDEQAEVEGFYITRVCAQVVRGVCPLGGLQEIEAGLKEMAPFCSVHQNSSHVVHWALAECLGSHPLTMHHA